MLLVDDGFYVCCYRARQVLSGTIQINDHPVIDINHLLIEINDHPVIEINHPVIEINDHRPIMFHT